MAHIVSASTCLEAWQKGCDLILAGDVFNLIVEINDPSQIDSTWFADYTPSKYANKDASLIEVVNTIIPYKQFIRNVPRDVIYDLYKRARKNTLKTRRWGTYFLRMIQFGLSQKNQLENIITNIRSSNRRMSGTNFIHITSSDISSNTARLGAPCMQYAQFIVHQTGTVDLVAVYRNHDYFSRALGNFVGLSYLLQFVCRESGKSVGKLTCHSIHAFNSKSSKSLKCLRN